MVNLTLKHALLTVAEGRQFVSARCFASYRRAILARGARWQRPDTQD